MEAQDRGGHRPVAADQQQPHRKASVGVRPESGHARGDRGGGEGPGGVPEEPIREEAQLRSPHALAGIDKKGFYFLLILWSVTKEEKVEKLQLIVE